MSNFSFSRSIFKGLILQTRENKGLFWKRVKALADDNFGGVQTVQFFFDIAENIVAERKNILVTSFFHLFRQCFQKASLTWSLKVSNFVNVLNRYRLKKNVYRVKVLLSRPLLLRRQPFRKLLVFFKKRLSYLS